MNEIAYSYLQKQAVSDGVLVDVSVIAKELGFQWPVAVTSVVWNEVLVPSADLHRRQTVGIRLRDLLCKLRDSVQSHMVAPELEFSLLYQMSDRVLARVLFRATCSPGDDGQPFVTVMVSGEG